MKEFDLLNENIKKINSQSEELEAIFSNERFKINEESFFYNTITLQNNPDSNKKEELIAKKVKKAKNRVYL